MQIQYDFSSFSFIWASALVIPSEEKAFSNLNKMPSDIEWGLIVILFRAQHFIHPSLSSTVHSPCREIPDLRHNFTLQKGKKVLHCKNISNELVTLSRWRDTVKLGWLWNLIRRYSNLEKDPNYIWTLSSMIMSSMILPLHFLKKLKFG